jgi:hypothetical protein
MARRFSVVFNEENAQRVETVADRLKVKPDSLLLHFLLEKLTEIEMEKTGEGNSERRRF